MREHNWLYIVLIYWAVINIVTFLLYGIDKWKARRAKWRIEESTLLWWAAAGGSVGALLGMKTWIIRPCIASSRGACRLYSLPKWQ